MNTIRFDAATHTYADDAGPLVAVTTVLAPLIDFSHLPPAIRDASLERGRLVHDAIAADNARDLDAEKYFAFYPDHRPYVDAWRSFRDARRFVPLLNEYRVASPVHRVAGTLDTLGVMDGHGALVDFKTGDPRDVAADLQTAAYLALAHDSAAAGDDALTAFFTRYPVVRRYAIQLKADGRFTVTAYTRAADYRDFMILAAAHHLIASRKPTRAREAA